MNKGIFPIIDHYYEPQFNPVHLFKSLSSDRQLNGIDLNFHEQLELLDKFDYNGELKLIPVERVNDLDYYYHNGSFESGDAEFLYNVIRYFKPHSILEIGSGFSTLMSLKAINKNKQENPIYPCILTCIEPYEMPWLEKLNIHLIRERVEKIDKNIFSKLNKNDILFIDSSHIIKPQGDVLVEFLEILPNLNSGVLIHVHDIFTPKDYLEEWIVGKNLFWNEQYILEAFLTNNNRFRIIGALNYLKHHHFEELCEKCPILRQESFREPGSFWIIKN